jgi:methionyl aminopeptidase
MSKPKNNIEIQKMRVAGRLAAATLDYITPFVKPGVTTGELNDLCHAFITQHGGIPAPLNYRGFPKSICTSLNDVVCHGIPSATQKLADGDIVNLDITTIVDGFHGDTSRMFLIGAVSDTARKLVDDTYEAMMAGIRTIRSGSQLADIGRAIQAHADARGYSVVRDYCGHGIGREFHSEPMVLHYASTEHGYDMRLRKGMTFTVEPMINLGTYQTKVLADDWTVVTADGKLSAQFEHTVLVTDDGFELLTASPAVLTKPPYAP